MGWLPRFHRWHVSVYLYFNHHRWLVEQCHQRIMCKYIGLHLTICSGIEQEAKPYPVCIIGSSAKWEIVTSSVKPLFGIKYPINLIVFILRIILVKAKRILSLFFFIFNLNFILDRGYICRFVTMVYCVKSGLPLILSHR